MTPREQGNANLLNVARALRESPNPDKFTMRRYQDGCGTPACALGHYAFRSDLQSLLKPGKNGDYLEYINPDSYTWADYDDPEILKHFDVTDGEAHFLFGSGGCNEATTPLQAAECIERFVHERGNV